MSRSSLLLVASALTLAACRGDLQATSDTGTATSDTTATSTSDTATTTGPATDSTTAAGTDSATGSSSGSATSAGSTGTTTGDPGICGGAAPGFNFLPAVNTIGCVGPVEIISGELYGSAGIDIAVGCVPDSSVRVYEGTALGKLFMEQFKFDANTVAAEDGDDVQLAGMAAVDIDEDMDDDLVLTTRNNVRWWINNGQVGYGDGQRLYVGPDVNLWAVAGGQFESSRWDVVAVDNSTPVLRYFDNDNGTYVVPNPEVTTSIPGGAWSLEVGDLDLNGRDDMVIPRSSNEGAGLTRVIVWGDQAPSATYNLPSDGSAVWAHLMDVDGDAMLDVIVSHGPQTNDGMDERIFVFTNELDAATPGFVETQTIPVADELRGLASGDMNCDDIVDLVVAAPSGAVYVLPGNGSALDAPVEVADGGFIADVTVADFDADGRDDFAYVDFNQAGFYIRYGVK